MIYTKRSRGLVYGKIRSKIIMAVMNYIAFFLLLLSSCEAYKVLVVYPVPSRSHSILGDGVVRNLLKDGIEVTYISAFEYKNPPPNLRRIDVSDNFKAFPADTINLSIILKQKQQFHDQYLIRSIMTNLVTQTIINENVQKLLNDPKEHFDAVVLEWMFSDVLSGFATLFNCPLIWKTPIEVNSGILRLIDTPPSPAYAGDMTCEDLSPFSFQTRVTELWKRTKMMYSNFMYYDDMETKVYETHIAPLIRKRGRDVPSYHDVRYNASLILGNSHVSMGQPLSIPQSYKPLGGYHIDEDLKPLPEDLKKIMDNAKHGVIYFSMGSNLKSKDWPQEIKTGLLKTFGSLKQTVLWKFEEKLADVPQNVHILQWAPQPSILSHPNCILFISHGGLLSTTETIYYGVPIIGIPVFADQFTNVNRAVAKGFGVKVDLTYDLAEDLKPAIEKVISNPTYKQRVKELSFIHHDRPIKPGVELVHWVKHVINTRGALHLRSPGLHVPLYQQLYLDLAAVLIGILVVIIIVLKYLYTVLFSKQKAKKVKKN